MQMVRGNDGNQFRQYVGQNIRNLNGYNVIKNVGNQVVQNAVQNPGIQNVGNQNGLIVVSSIANQNVNQIGNDNVVAARAKGNGNGNANNGDLEEIEEVNANCILMANLQQASTSGTHTDKAPIYDSDGSAKQAQQKQQSLYNGKVLLEKHDPPVVYDSEETLQLAQESRLKMKQFNKEIKSENYAKINQLSMVFVSQKAKSHEESYFSNTSKTANVSKSISIINEEFSDDTSPTKFVRDFKSLAKEAPESLAKHKALEYEIEHLLKAVISHDIMSIVQDTLDPLSQKLENENVELEFQGPKKDLLHLSLGNLEPALGGHRLEECLNLKEKIITSSESECQPDSSRGNSNLFMLRRLEMLKAYDRKSEASHKFHLEVYGNDSLWK
ncbi:hypothetical protein Tco_1023437 [Tanacetum coccineum]